MLPTPILSVLRSPVARYVGAALAVAVLLWGIDRAAFNRGVAAAEGRHALAEIKARDAAEKAIAEANSRADKISRNLDSTQRRLEGLKYEYLTYANAITGHCPGTLGLLTSAASHGQPLPATSGQPADSPAADGAAAAATIPARVIGANIAINYTRFQQCLAQYNALLDWHEGALKKE